MKRGAAARAFGALGTTLGVQLWLALTASAAAVTSGPVLDRYPNVAGDLQDALEVLTRQPDLWRVWAAAFGVTTLVHLLSLPALQLSWCYALAHGEPPGPSLRFGLTHYGAALKQSGVVWSLGLVGAVALALLPMLVWDRVESDPEPRRLWAISLSSVPLGLWVLWCGLWHDLARAHLATHGGLRLRGLFAQAGRALQPKHFASYLLFVALWVPLLVSAPSIYGARLDLAGLATAQGLLLLRGIVRSVWLARATLLAESRAAR